MGRIKLKEYQVKLNVFFMVSRFVKATSEEEAIKKAKDDVRYGEGEELTVFEVNEV